MTSDGNASEAAPESFRDRLVAEIPNLRAFAVSLSGSIQNADDLVQDTLLKAWGNAEKFQPGTSLRAWLFTILRNTYCTTVLRRIVKSQARRLVPSSNLSRFCQALRRVS